MFNCYLHGWTHIENPCPLCNHQLIITTSGTSLSDNAFLDKHYNTESKKPIEKKEETMFDFHTLNDEGKKAVTEFKGTIAESVKKCLEMMPDGREKAIFTTKLEEAVFFGTKAIASKEGNFESKQSF